MLYPLILLADCEGSDQYLHWVWSALSLSLINTFTESDLHFHWVWSTPSLSLICTFTESDQHFHWVWSALSLSLINTFTESDLHFHWVWSIPSLSLICTFTVRLCLKTLFRMARPIYNIYMDTLAILVFVLNAFHQDFRSQDVSVRSLAFSCDCIMSRHQESTLRQWRTRKYGLWKWCQR